MDTGDGPIIEIGDQTRVVYVRGESSFSNLAAEDSPRQLEELGSSADGADEAGSNLLSLSPRVDDVEVVRVTATPVQKSDTLNILPPRTNSEELLTEREVIKALEDELEMERKVSSLTRQRLEGQIQLLTRELHEAHAAGERRAELLEEGNVRIRQLEDSLAAARNPPSDGPQESDGVLRVELLKYVSKVQSLTKECDDLKLRAQEADALKKEVEVLIQERSTLEEKLALNISILQDEQKLMADIAADHSRELEESRSQIRRLHEVVLSTGDSKMKERLLSEIDRLKTEVAANANLLTILQNHSDDGKDIHPITSRGSELIRLTSALHEKDSQLRHAIIALERSGGVARALELDNAQLTRRLAVLEGAHAALSDGHTRRAQSLEAENRELQKQVSDLRRQAAEHQSYIERVCNMANERSHIAQRHAGEAGALEAARLAEMLRQCHTEISERDARILELQEAAGRSAACLAAAQHYEGDLCHELTAKHAILEAYKAELERCTAPPVPPVFPRYDEPALFAPPSAEHPPVLPAPVVNHHHHHHHQLYDHEGPRPLSPPRGAHHYRKPPPRVESLPHQSRGFPTGYARSPPKRRPVSPSTWSDPPRAPWREEGHHDGSHYGY